MSIPRWDSIPLMTKKAIQSKYTFGQAIGEGAEGVVLSGHQRGDQPVPIAAKLISISPKFIPFALVESKLQAATKHAAVPLVIDLFRDEDYVYIIQEYVEGIPLFDLLVEHTFSEDECKIIAHQLLDLLDYLHNEGTIHCDIKPDNIIYDETTHKVYLLDFGSAKKLSQRDRMSRTGGAIGYYAPEILNGGFPCPASDVWALGVLLYTLMSRHPPFFSHTEHRTDEELMESAPFWYFNNEDSENLRNEIVEGFVDVDHLPPLVGNLLQKLLLVEPDERYTAAEALKHPWFEDIIYLSSKLQFSRVLRDVGCKQPCAMRGPLSNISVHM